jgi:hypothetical protein
LYHVFTENNRKLARRHIWLLLTLDPEEQLIEVVLEETSEKKRAYRLKVRLPATIES